MTHDDVRLFYSHLMDGDRDTGLVPAYHFIIRNANAGNVGHVNFRVGDTEHVRLSAGHIGYAVFPGHRGHRYAGKACLAIAPFVAQLYPEGVIITSDPDNFPSIRAIEKIGGIFIDEIDLPEHDPQYQNGHFRKRRYRWSPDAA